jgi:cysteine desulfurase / selenocysteine lyase
MNRMTHDDMGWRERIAGLEAMTPLLDGRMIRYINLDNAASTPPLIDVLTVVQEVLRFYSSVHRGTGFKSRFCTAAYDEAHETLAHFVGADPLTNTVVFVKNTTEAINKLAYRFPLGRDRVVISTMMEHHSNDLPWRRRSTVLRAGVTPEGRLDEAHLDRLLDEHRGRVALLTVSGASNVTGFVQPIHRLARKAHVAGAKIFVDAAQLAAHRRIDVKADDDPEHLDFVALSAHKMYAPFGVGALIGQRGVFLDADPEHQGGGTVDIVTPTEVRWADLPDREEAGSPNVVGAVALAVAARALMAADMDDLARHEASLTAYALDGLRSIPGITLYGQSNTHQDGDRVGVIAFNLQGVHHALVAAILGYEGGIGVRSGCFCAQPYVACLLNLSGSALTNWQHEPGGANRAARPGMVRISFAAYNTRQEIDALIEMLLRITRHDYEGQYYQVPESGEYKPAGYEEPTRSLLGDYREPKNLVVPVEPRNLVVPVAR